ncbi:cyclic pyranopterin monophosphate synthase MoaC [Candidatus Acetothermia bacterium]|nr:cyclic pyranopterin monophosphate synthase MoaC [Candidatus Acetothermia bacterium]
MKKAKLSHLDAHGHARMVDVSAKPDTVRIAIAQGKIVMRPSTLQLILEGTIKKGDVLTVAKIAAIQGAKRTAELIPMCHPIPITGIDIEFTHDKQEANISVAAAVTSAGKTGVEMEALTACATALLTIYDMCKAVEKGMTIGPIQLIEKRGGKSGTWNRDRTAS